MIADNPSLAWAVPYLPFNPAYCLVMANRQIFGVGAEVPQELFPHSLEQCILYSAIWAVAAFFIGYAAFMSKRHKFADLV